MLETLRGHAYDLSTIVGRIVARLRIEHGLTQAELATKLEFDRSLLVRLETGRNTTNIDHLFLIEAFFLRARLLQRHGDVTLLAADVARRLKKRGAVPVYGMLPKPENVGDVESPALDRVVTVALDEWLQGLNEPKRNETKRTRRT